MNFLELLYKLHHKAHNIVSALFSLDFSLLDKKVLGLISVLDIVAVILGAYIIKEIFIFFLKAGGIIIQHLFNALFLYGSTFVLAYGSIVFTRAYYTLLFLSQRIITNQKLQAIYHIIKK